MPEYECQSMNGSCSFSGRCSFSGSRSTPEKRNDKSIPSYPILFLVPANNEDYLRPGQSHVTTFTFDLRDSQRGKIKKCSIYRDKISVYDEHPRAGDNIQHLDIRAVNKVIKIMCNNCVIKICVSIL